MPCPHTSSSSSVPPAPYRLRPCPVHNRLRQVMVHINWYLFSPQARLARDASISKSALCRVLSGQAAPSFALIWKVTKALERRLGAKLPTGHLDPGELFSLDGTYPTSDVCTLVGCPGCRMAEALAQEKTQARKEAGTATEPGVPCRETTAKRSITNRSVTE